MGETDSTRQGGKGEHRGESCQHESNCRSERSRPILVGEEWPDIREVPPTLWERIKQHPFIWAVVSAALGALFSYLLALF